MKKRMLLTVGALLGLGAVLAMAPHDVEAQSPRRGAPRLHHHPPPRIGQVVPRLPGAHTRLTYRDLDFYYYRGRFYRPGGTGYLIVPTPVGARFSALPYGATRVQVGVSIFYHHSGVFFTQAEAGYEVVAAPVGATVHMLPVGYSVMEFDGEELYVCDGVFYRYDPGRDLYVVVEPPPEELNAVR